MGESIIVPISDFKQEFKFTHEVFPLGNVDIVFLKQGPNGFIKLSVASLTVR